jgi:hypothetical protein
MIILKNGFMKLFVFDLGKNCKTKPKLYFCFLLIDVFSPTEFTPEVLQNFDVPILLIHTKFDESNGISLLNNSKSPNPSSNQSFSSNSLLPNYNRKSTLANSFNCDEIFIVKINLISFTKK